MCNSIFVSASTHLNESRCECYDYEAQDYKEVMHVASVEFQQVSNLTKKYIKCIVCTGCLLLIMHYAAILTRQLFCELRWIGTPSRKPHALMHRCTFHHTDSHRLTHA